MMSYKPRASRRPCFKPSGAKQHQVAQLGFKKAIS